jgi:hypothetical protein
MNVNIHFIRYEDLETAPTSKPTPKAAASPSLVAAIAEGLVGGAIIIALSIVIVMLLRKLAKNHQRQGRQEESEHRLQLLQQGDGRGD